VGSLKGGDMVNKTKTITFLIILLISFSVIFGCKMRTYSVVRERPDRETYGNQGYLMGGSDESTTIEQKSRKTYVFEFESGKPKIKKEKKVVLGEEIFVEESEELDFWEEPEVIEESYEESFVETSSQERTYIIKKGDTLQKISKKFYGTSRAWKKIFDANTDRLASPDKIKPGQVLIIP